MVGETVQSALQSLKNEKARIESAIAALEGLVEGGVPARRKRRGRPGRKPKAKKAAEPKATGGRKRKNAPRGLLKKTIHSVLKGLKKPLSPAELRNQVMKAGYPLKNRKTLYTAVFTAAKKDPEIKKTSEGFMLKG